MKWRENVRKVLAALMCLVMLTSLLGVVALAEEDAPAAPAVEAKPVAEAPAPAPAAEAKPAAPAVEAKPAADPVTIIPGRADAPTVVTIPERVDAPAKGDAPSVPDRAEAPAVAEVPAGRPETPVGDTPAAQPEAPVGGGATRPAGGRLPVAQPEEDEDETPAPLEADLPMAAELDEPPMTAAAFSNAAGLVTGMFVVDWDEVEKLPTESWSSNRWAVVQGDGGYYFYFEAGPWDGCCVGVYYDDAPDTWADQVAYYGWNEGHLLGLNNAVIADAFVTSYVDGSLRYTEGYVPGEHFNNYDFTFSCGATKLHASDVPLMPGQRTGDLPQAQAEVEEEEEAVYTGIVIDGQVKDWDAVPRHDIPDHLNGYAIDQCAVVWDGDYVYILLAEYGEEQNWGRIVYTGNWNSVTGGGTHGHGQYAITTDLGRTMLIQPIVNGSNEPAVAGVNGALVAVNNKQWEQAPHYWELAIPTSELPEYLETISFGYYMETPVVTGLSNLKDVGGAVSPFQANVVIDGKYNDWIGYPHELIEYDTQGIQHHKVDGEGALWSNDGWLYGHVVTEHPDHLDEQGGCFLGDVAIAFNGDRSYKALPHDGNFYPQFVTINDDGTFTVYNDGTRLENGTYTFQIFDCRENPLGGLQDEDGNWYVRNTAQLYEYSFGTMKVTINGTHDEAEFQLDLRKVANFIQQDGDTAFKTIEIQWGKIGPQWITTAGTPTGPILGVALAVCAVSAPACVAGICSRRKGKKEQDGDQQAG